MAQTAKSIWNRIRPFAPPLKEPVPELKYDEDEDILDALAHLGEHDPGRSTFLAFQKFWDSLSDTGKINFIKTLDSDCDEIS